MKGSGGEVTQEERGNGPLDELLCIAWKAVEPSYGPSWSSWPSASPARRLSLPRPRRVVSSYEAACDGGERK